MSDSNIDIVREAIEERDDFERRYHDLANEMIYEGNSISWIKSKADNYSRALQEAWKALSEIGIHPDGNTDIATAIRKFACKKED